MEQIILHSKLSMKMPLENFATNGGSPTSSKLELLLVLETLWQTLATWVQIDTFLHPILITIGDFKILTPLPRASPDVKSRGQNFILYHVHCANHLHLLFVARLFASHDVGHQ